MGKKISEDEIKWILSVNSTQAQQEIRSLEKANKDLKKSNKALTEEQVKLIAAGKKESEEFRNISKEIKKNNSILNQNTGKIKDLEKSMGLTSLTMNQLRRKAKELQRQLSDTSKQTNPEEYSQLERELGAVRDRMDEVQSSSNRVRGAMGSVEGGIKKVGFAIKAFVLYKVGEYLKSIATKAFEVRAEFAKYEAVLRNTLGTQKAAAVAMKMIKDVAAASPGSVKEWTDSYVKLVNRGLNPTKRELVAIGDIASSQGKDVDMFVEAVLDAMTGENERLKEFGIKASKNGDVVRYTFKGITTEVANNEQAIKNYLVTLGDLEGVQGSMAVQMNELGGFASNFKDRMDGLYNTIGKRLTPVMKYFFTSMGELVDDATTALTPMNEQFDNQLSKIVGLQQTLPGLAQRYDDLKSKVNLTSEEHAELNTVITKVASIVPSAITQWDKYGNAISINTVKVREYLIAEKARLRFMNREAINEANKQLSEAQKKYEMQLKIVKAGGELKVGQFGGLSFNDYSNEEMEEAQSLLLALGETIKGAEAEIKRLSGTDLEEWIEKQMKAEKESAEARVRFTSMNKQQLEQWLKDEKNASDQYKVIAKEIYDARFPSSSAQDNSDPNAVALKNLETTHTSELNLIRLNGNEKKQTDEQINQTLYQSEQDYLNKRIQLLQKFALTAKKEAKKAEYNNQIVEDKNKLLDLESKIDRARLNEAKKTRSDALAVEEAVSKETQISLQKQLEDRSISQDQYDMLLMSRQVAAAQNRLSIEQNFLEAVNALELNNGNLKAEAVTEANKAVLDADAAAATARVNQQKTLDNLVKDFKSQFKATTVDEDLQAQLKVLDAAYQARKEMAIRQNLDSTELDRAYFSAKEQLTENAESRLNQIRNQYGLLNQQQLFDIELQELKSNLDQKLLTQEEYESAVLNLKRDSYKKQFDYYSNLFSGAITALQQSEMDQIDAKYDVEIAAAKGNSEEIERLENEKEQKKLDVQKKYADANFAIKVSQIIADTAVSIMKAYADLGPIAGSIAAALLGVTGFAQMSSAKAERDKIKNMTVGSSSSSATTGTLTATGLEDGGKIDVTRSQDGKRFRNALYDPDRRGYVDKPTVITGEGPAGSSREWIASNAAVENPTIAPFISLLDKHQQAGTIRTLDLNQVIRANMAGYASGGSIDKSPAVSTTQPRSQPVNAGVSEDLQGTLNELIIVVKDLQENGIAADVSLTDLERKQNLRNKSRKIGNKR